ncbi:MAG: AAA family ATPase [Ignavibacteria bacterium]|jgi:ATP-dependent protease Clp ATPase subunit
MVIAEQKQFITETSKIIEIFKASEGEIRPHFIVTGPSGSGKSTTVQMLTQQFELDFLEINAAQLTKEGTSGNSLSKALAPLAQKQGQLTICFVDEFDKLFISGNSNSSLAHESTNGVQNEFLKVLESDNASVFGDYGKYVNTSVKNVLFVFAGAFNGEEDITIDRLRDFGIKTEFLGRVGLVFNTPKISLDSMFDLVDNSEYLTRYLQLFPTVKKSDVTEVIKTYVKANYEKNTLGIRLINTLITQYFVKGGKLGFDDVKPISFQKTLSL